MPVYEDTVRRFYYTGGEVSRIFDFSTMYYFEYFKNGKRRKFGSFIISDSSYSKFSLLNDDYYKLLERICPIGQWTILNTHGKVIYNGELQCLLVNAVDSCEYEDGFTEVFYVTDFKIPG
jgi:hypothetical protein